MANDPIRPGAPQLQDIECDQGAAFDLPLLFCNPDSEGNPDLSSPQNLTGKTFVMKVFESQSDRAKTIVTLTVVNTDLAHGKINARLAPADATAIVAGEYYYYCFETTQKRYYMEGAFRVIAHKM